MEPTSTDSRPQIILSNVDLPHPLGPSSATISPFEILILIAENIVF